MDFIIQILVIVLPLLIGAFGSYFAVFKKYVKVAKEGADVFVKLYEASEDDKYTDAEIRGIVKEAKEFYEAIKSL